MSIASLLESDREDQAKIYGIVTGIVTNNKDPEKMGRVKVKIPRFSDTDESNWARVGTLMAGNNKGTFYLPDVNDEVLVAFELGDINMPYVIGSLWNGKDTPPETNANGENNIKLIKSRSGHLIRLNDKSGSEKIEIIDKSGKNSIEIDTAKNSITINSGKDITLSAKGKITIDAATVEIKASGSGKFQANGSLDLKASGTTNVKGGMVNIN
jgi:uncharacterized protein involved in type VI secretion and phage assembly